MGDGPVDGPTAAGDRPGAPRADGDRAAVDVGTNTMRLLVVDEDGGSLARRLRMVRLGQAVDATGHLHDDAIRRALAAYEDFRDEWRRLGVRDARVVLGATSAVRDAADRERFLDAALDLAPDVEVRVLTGEEEAAGAFRGVAASLPDLDRPLVVVDIGGGSTELVAGDVDDRVVASTSVQLGSVRLTERLMPSDPPTEAELLGALAEVRAQLERAVDELGGPPVDGGTLVGVAGTVTTIAAMHGSRGRWVDGEVHGTILTADDVLATSTRLAVADRATIAEDPAVQDGREDVITAGSLVLRGVLDVLRADRIVVSEADGLDGLVA